jgi:RNA polymerase subunit RPABC4/transcription elongation factor Spt4
MNSYQQGQDRDRQYQNQVYGQSANMMQAAKQNVPTTYVAGGGGSGVQTYMGIPAGQAQPAVPAQQAAAAAGGACSSCGEALKPNWKSCPACGTAVPVVAAGGACAKCGAATKPNWKACPECGTQL